MSAVVGLDLVAHPDLALELKPAVAIMFEGMIRGMFTGKKLAAYFHGNVADFYNVRRINGVDRASTIAAIA